MVEQLCVVLGTAVLLLLLLHLLQRAVLVTTEAFNHSLTAADQRLAELLLLVSNVVLVNMSGGSREAMVPATEALVYATGKLQQERMHHPPRVMFVVRDVREEDEATRMRASAGVSAALQAAVEMQRGRAPAGGDLDLCRWDPATQLVLLPKVRWPLFLLPV